MDFHRLSRKDLQFLCKNNGIPANQSNIAMASALQALKTIEGIEEIQAALGFQSPKKPGAKSPELPRTSGRTSVRRSIHGDEPKIQEQLASSLPRPGQETVKALEVIEMASKDEEGEKKEAPKHFPKTQATTRRTSRGQEAPSSMGKANQEDHASVDTSTSVHTGHTRQVRRAAAETQKVVEAKEGKSIGVMTRRMPSRKAVEKTATGKAVNRCSSSSAEEAVKMDSLAKEGAEEQETVDEKKTVEKTTIAKAVNRSSRSSRAKVAAELAKEGADEQETIEEKKVEKTTVNRSSRSSRAMVAAALVKEGAEEQETVEEKKGAEEQKTVEEEKAVEKTTIAKAVNRSSRSCRAKVAADLAKEGADEQETVEEKKALEKTAIAKAVNRSSRSSRAKVAAALAKEGAEEQETLEEKKGAEEQETVEEEKVEKTTIAKAVNRSSRSSRAKVAADEEETVGEKKAAEKTTIAKAVNRSSRAKVAAALAKEGAEEQESVKEKKSAEGQETVEEKKVEKTATAKAVNRSSRSSRAKVAAALGIRGADEQETVEEKKAVEKTATAKAVNRSSRSSRAKVAAALGIRGADEQETVEEKKVEKTATAKAVNRRSSRSRAKVAAALAKEGAEEQETVDEKKDSAENGDSTDVLVEDVGKNDQEVKSHGISSIDVENSKVKVMESPEEKVGENNQEMGSSLLDSEKEKDAAGKELVDASLLEKSSMGEIGLPEEKSTMVEESSKQTPKDEALKDSSSSWAEVIISADTEVLLDSEKEKEAGKEPVDASLLEKSSMGSPEEKSTEMKESNNSNEAAFASVEDSSKQTPKDEALKDSSSSGAKVTISADTEVLLSCGVERGEEIHGFSSLLDPEKEKDAGKELVDASLLEKSSIIMTPLSGEIGSPEENPTAVKDSNEAFASAEDSSKQTPKDEALKDSSSSGVNVTISSDTGVLLSSTDVGSEKENDENLLAVESGDALPEAGIVQHASFIYKNSTSDTDFVEDVTNGDACYSETSHIELPKQAEESICSPPAVVAPEDDSKNHDAVKNLCDEPLVTEGIGVSFAFPPNKGKEIATEESIDRGVLQDAGELEVSIEMLLHETVTLQDDDVKETGEILEVPPQEAGELASKEFVEFVDIPRGSEVDVLQDNLEVSVEMPQEVKETGCNLTSEIPEVPPQEAGELAAKEFMDVPPRGLEDTSIDRVFQDASELEASVEMPQEAGELASKEFVEFVDIPRGSEVDVLQDVSNLEVSVEMPQEVKETGGNLTGEIPEVPPQETGELAAKEFVDVPPRGSEDTSIDRVFQDASELEASVEMPPELQETCELEVSVEMPSIDRVFQDASELEETGGNLTGETLEVPLQETCELAVEEFVDVPPRGSEYTSIDRVFQDASELEVSVEMPPEVMETGGNLTGETLEVLLQETCELTTVEEFVNVLHQEESEISRDTSFETSATVVDVTVAESVDEEGKEIEEPTESMVLQKTEILQDASFELQISVPSTETLPVTEKGADEEGKETSGEFPIEIAAVIEEPTESMDVLQKTEILQDAASSELQISVPSAETFQETEEGADDHSNETMRLSGFSIVQIQSTDSEVAAFEMAEEKEDIKAVEKQKSFEDENIAAELSLSKLKSMYKQKQRESKNMVENKAVVKDEKLAGLSLAKLKTMYKQKLDDRKNEVNKQEDLQCLSHSKLYGTQKLNDGRNKLGKRTPLKNLN